jgi:hypothetical protein
VWPSNSHIIFAFDIFSHTGISLYNNFLASAYHFTDKIGAKKTLEGATRRKQFQKGKCISDTQLAAKTQTSDL